MKGNDWSLAVETGGTKMVARITSGDVNIAEQRWPTTTPDAAEAALVAFVDQTLPHGARLAAAGIAAFGPVVVDPDAPDYGRVLPTPKPGWSGSNLRAALAQRWSIPVTIDTDVNAAALAEQQAGAGRGCPTLAYVTVGTGIGVGLAAGGSTLKGVLHPELGHAPVIRLAGDDAPSRCPFHANCAEGLAAGPAVQARLEGRKLEDAAAEFGAVADYIGQLFATIVLAWSPHRIVAGGGVLTTPGLRDAARERMAHALGGYGVGDAALDVDFVLGPMLEHAGLEGASLMARRTVEWSEYE